MACPPRRVNGAWWSPLAVQDQHGHDRGRQPDGYGDGNDPDHGGLRLSASSTRQGGAAIGLGGIVEEEPACVGDGTNGQIVSTASQAEPEAPGGCAAHLPGPDDPYSLCEHD